MIEFNSPYPLQTCLTRLQEQHDPGSFFMKSRFNVTTELLGIDSANFKVITSMGRNLNAEGIGTLTQQPNGQTAVSLEVKWHWIAQVFMTVIAGIWICMIPAMLIVAVLTSGLFILMVVPFSLVVCGTVILLARSQKAAFQQKIIDILS